MEQPSLEGKAEVSVVPGRIVRDRVRALGRRPWESPSLPPEMLYYMVSLVVSEWILCPCKETGTWCCTWQTVPLLAMQSDGAGDEWVLGFPACGQALRSQLTEMKARQTGRKECSGIGDLHILQPAF